MMIQPLPVPTKIFGGEGLISYATRHATRNGTSVEEIEQALTLNGSIRPPLGRQSPEREQAWRDLGALHHSAFKTPQEFNDANVIVRQLCLHCTNGTSGSGMTPRIGWVCIPHRRWIGTTQHNIHAMPELAVAERRYRRILVPRGALVGSPIMDMARECALVGIGPDALTRRSLLARSSDATLLTYPESIKVAQLITDPAFNIQMLRIWLTPSRRHEEALRAVASLFPEDENNESWRAAHAIGAMFNAIAREIKKLPTKTLGEARIAKTLGPAWKLKNR